MRPYPTHQVLAILHTDRAEVALACEDTAAAQRELRRALPHAHQHVRRLRFWLVTLAGLLLAEIDEPAQHAATMRFTYGPGDSQTRRLR